MNKVSGIGYRAGLVLALLLIAGCKPEPIDQADTDVSFVNQVWRVSESSAVAPGTLYTFLAEGTLVIASPNTRPLLGQWRYENGALTMVEESIPYAVDILEMKAGRLLLRSNNPGEPVSITLMAAERTPLSE